MDELKTHLIASGISEEQAETIAAGFQKSESGEDVDVDRLTKAMQDVKAQFTGGDEEEDADAGDAEKEGEEVAQLEKALTEASDIVDVVTRGADAILSEVRAQNEAMAKGMLAMADTITDLRDRLVARDEEMKKSLTLVENQLAEPNMRKSVSSDISVIPTPGEGKGSNTVDLINKALTELRESDNNERQTQLGSAVALLEAGADASDIATRYGL